MRHSVQELQQTAKSQWRTLAVLVLPLVLWIQPAAAEVTRGATNEPVRTDGAHPGIAPPAHETASDDKATGPVLNLPFSYEEAAWFRAAWAYFYGPPPAQAPTPSPMAVSPDNQNTQREASAEGGVPVPAPQAPAFLVPSRGGTNVATPWSMGDQVAALLLAHRLGLLDSREFDGRFTRLVEFFNRMPLAPGGMPNRFYDSSSGATLGGDLQPGVAGWSSVDTGRLLLWLRIASEAHPQFAPFIRNAVARLNVCRILSEDGHLQLGTVVGGEIQLSSETIRGYDAYAAQGYRAWNLDVPIPKVANTYPFEIEVHDIAFPVAEDHSTQAPVMTTPPAYLGFEFGFNLLGDDVDDEIGGGRAAEEFMRAVAEAQANRYTTTGSPTARADFRRSDDPTTLYGTILVNGYPWSVITPDGTLRADLGLISTRAAFALDAFADDPNANLLLPLVGELYDPQGGWYEGRYEQTGAYEQTRSSATNAFVMEALAYRHLGPLYPDSARPAEFQPIVPGPDGACRLPGAVVPLGP
jgi:hypothetical protein